MAEITVQILELSQRAHQLYVTQEPAEKNKLLKILLSNSVLEDGIVTPTYAEPFATLALMKEEAGR